MTQKRHKTNLIFPLSSNLSIWRQRYYHLRKARKIGACGDAFCFQTHLVIVWTFH